MVLFPLVVVVLAKSVSRRCAGYVPLPGSSSSSLLEYSAESCSNIRCGFRFVGPPGWFRCGSLFCSWWMFCMVSSSSKVFPIGQSMGELMTEVVSRSDKSPWFVVGLPRVPQWSVADGGALRSRSVAFRKDSSRCRGPRLAEFDGQELDVVSMEDSSGLK